MIVDVTTLRLRDGVDEATFRVADAALQATCSAAPGFARRTTALVAGGDILVVSLWDSADSADALDAHPSKLAMEAVADVVDRRQGTTLD